MPTPPKPLDPTRSAADWFGVELRHRRLSEKLTQDALGQRVYMSGALIGKIEKAERRCPKDLAAALDRALETDGLFIRAWQLLAAETDNEKTHPDSADRCATNGRPEWTLGGASSPRPNEQVVDRRTFIAASVSWPALLAVERAPAEPAIERPQLAELASTLTVHCRSGQQVSDIAALEHNVATVKERYQACQYGQTIRSLSPLLRQLTSTAEGMAGDELCGVNALLAATYQVTASIFLKFGDMSIASVAADRSMSAATKSKDPITIAASARAVTHALMRSGHHHGAVQLATTEAARLDTSPTTAALSVRGALLLRGAIAAAEIQDRHTATNLLSAADGAARQLAEHANHVWTGFNPINVLLHRVHVAVALGDAGHAIEIARMIDIEQIGLVERRACLAINVATAYTQWGRYNKALDALRLALATAPEETRARSHVRSILKTLDGVGSATLRSNVRDFATQLGAAK